MVKLKIEWHEKMTTQQNSALILRGLKIEGYIELLKVCVNVINRLLHCRDFFRLVIWNLKVKLFFKRHY